MKPYIQVRRFVGLDRLNNYLSGISPDRVKRTYCNGKEYFVEVEMRL